MSAITNSSNPNPTTVFSFKKGFLPLEVKELGTTSRQLFDIPFKIAPQSGYKPSEPQRKGMSDSFKPCNLFMSQLPELSSLSSGQTSGISSRKATSSLLSVDSLLSKIPTEEQMKAMLDELVNNIPYYPVPAIRSTLGSEIKNFPPSMKEKIENAKNEFSKILLEVLTTRSSASKKQ